MPNPVILWEYANFHQIGFKKNGTFTKWMPDPTFYNVQIQQVEFLTVSYYYHIY